MDSREERVAKHDCPRKPLCGSRCPTPFDPMGVAHKRTRSENAPVRDEYSMPLSSDEGERNEVYP